MAATHQRGFTLIDLMITVAVVVLLAAVTLPSYSGSITRARIAVGLDALNTHAIAMERGFEATGSYGGATCRAGVPGATHFTLSCTLSPDGHGYTTTATGTGPLAGHAYSIDQHGTHRTLAHPRGVPGSDCWSIRGGRCDS